MSSPAFPSLLPVRYSREVVQVQRCSELGRFAVQRVSTHSLGLMRTAAFHALERLHGVAWRRDINTFYPPLGESLAGTSALAEAWGRTQEPVLSGLTHARSCTPHGAVVVPEISTPGPWAHR